MNFFFNFFFILFFVVSYHSFCQPNFLSKNKKANKLYYEGVSFSKIGEFELGVTTRDSRTRESLLAVRERLIISVRWCGTRGHARAHVEVIGVMYTPGAADAE